MWGTPIPTWSFVSSPSPQSIASYYPTPYQHHSSQQHQLHPVYSCTQFVSSVAHWNRMRLIRRAIADPPRTSPMRYVTYSTTIIFEVSEPTWFEVYPTPQDHSTRFGTPYPTPPRIARTTPWTPLWLSSGYPFWWLHIYWGDDHLVTL